MEKFIKDVLKNTIGDNVPNSHSDQSACSSSKQSSVGDFEEQDGSPVGLRSHAGPFGGRSVKEVEEQLVSLKKENFNLKLRIYFLEEKLGVNFTLDKNNVVKKNIEMQIEMARLQRECREHHELLAQAVKTIDLEEEEHKKQTQAKDEQIDRLQHEMEQLRVQLEERPVSASERSEISYACNKIPENDMNAGQDEYYVAELQERLKFLEIDVCNLRAQNEESVQIIYDQTQTLKVRYEALQKENQTKNETINRLNEELNSANDRLIDFAQQVKDYEKRLSQAHQENQNLILKMQEDQKSAEELYGQVSAVTQKYSALKYELDRERKTAERSGMMKDLRIGELENENEKSKLRIKELQTKLEAALTEAKKNQNLAVSKSRSLSPRSPHTDVGLVSVSNAATPDGAQKTGSVPVQVGTRTKAPPTPDGKALSAFERLLTTPGGDRDRLLAGLQGVKDEVAAYKLKIVKLKGEQLKACEIIKNMIDLRSKNNEEIAQLKKKTAELERELESMVSQPVEEPKLWQSEFGATTTGTPPCEKPMAESQQTDDLEIVEHYKALTIALEEKVEVLVATLHEKDSQMQNIRAQYDEVLNILEEKENRIIDLEFEILSNQQSGRADKSVLEKGDNMESEKHSSFYKQELEERDKEIERLNSELKKCTCYLQEIVNKELWEKNREIEKMHKKHENTTEVTKLRNALTIRDKQLSELKEKITELGLDINISNDNTPDIGGVPSPLKDIEHLRRLQDQLKAAKEEKKYFEAKLEAKEASSHIMEQLKYENEELKNEIGKSEKLRSETNEVCSVLSSRLEELAIFLDSLLKQKSVLGFLGSAKNRKLREIINNSLDLSRSLSMSLMADPEQSLAQLSNITALLNGSVFQDLSLAEDCNFEEESHLSIVPSNITLTYESHLYKKVKGSEANNEQVIAALREQVFNLKSELQLRDIELNKLNGKESGIEKLTETEDDKQISKLFTSVKCNTSAALKQQSEVQSESEAWSEPDRIVSRARIGLNHSAPQPFRSVKLSHNESTEDDDIFREVTPSKRRQSMIELHQEICRLERELQQKSEDSVINTKRYRQRLQEMDKELEETKEQLARAQEEKHQAETKIKNLQEIVEELGSIRTQYEENLILKSKEIQDKINNFEKEKEKLTINCLQFEKQATEAQNEVEQASDKIRSMEEAISQLEESLRTEYESSLIVKLKAAEEAFADKVKDIEERWEYEVQQAQEAAKEIQEECHRDYIKKTEVEQKLMEVERLISELDSLNLAVQTYEETIKSYKEKESNMEIVLQESGEKANKLQKDLDDVTLQYSEAVLEKTKLCDEKAQLEQILAIKEEELRRQLNDVRDQLTNVTERYRDEVSALQIQKSNLELKVCELESLNAELQSKLIKYQTGKSYLNASMPNIGSRQLVTYRRQCSDQNYSSEDNADEVQSFSFGRSIGSRAVPQTSHAEAERIEANCSPDLGIESDHGRFSSLETQAHNIPRPLLQTVELTESMNNLFDGQNNQVQTAIAGSDHCCQKSLEIVQENNELKRKLLKMKRALEETAMQLNLANQRKKQVEKTICKQIHKTSQVLRKAKANLDSGSESDVLRM